MAFKVKLPLRKDCVKRRQAGMKTDTMANVLEAGVTMLFAIQLPRLRSVFTSTTVASTWYFVETDVVIVRGRGAK